MRRSMALRRSGSDMMCMGGIVWYILMRRPRQRDRSRQRHRRRRYVWWRRQRRRRRRRPAVRAWILGVRGWRGRRGGVGAGDGFACFLIFASSPLVKPRSNEARSSGEDVALFFSPKIWRVLSRQKIYIRRCTRTSLKGLLIRCPYRN